MNLESSSDRRSGGPTEAGGPLGTPVCAPPAWACELLGSGALETEERTLLESPAWSLVGARLRGARGMPAGDLRRATRATYDDLRRTISSLAHRYPVRFWNMLPHIQEPMGGGLDRYMAFNLGRRDAFRDWSGGADDLAGVVPTATGVGHRGDDLLVYALCADRPAEPVENPRQQPAWRYSTRYGPAPPCFARAGRLELPGGLVALFVGGTASVRGEDSHAPHDLEEQLAETFRNLDAVVAAGLAGADAAWLSEARAYVLADADLAAVRGAVLGRLPSLARLELCRADICRPELRVEIEGLAVARRTPRGLVREPRGVEALRGALG